MKERSESVEQAAALFAQENHCAHSLVMAFAPLMEVDPGTAIRLAAPFGGGIGRMARTCGAVNGALMVLGMRFGHQRVDQEEAKEQVYRLARELVTRFEQMHGSIACQELLGQDMSDPEAWQRAREEGLFRDRCLGFVRDAAGLVEELIQGE